MKQLILFLLVLLSLPADAQLYWNTIPSGTTKRLTSISFGSPFVGYVGGVDSLLLKSTDGGRTWHTHSQSGLQFTLSSPDIVHLNFVDANTGFAIVGNYDRPVYSGTTFKTTDGGATWLRVVSGNIASMRTFFFDAQNGFQVGSAFFAGCIVEKLSAGAWAGNQSLDFNPLNFLRSIDCYNGQVCITGSDEGYVYRSFDGGASWDTVKTPTDSSINALRFLNARTVMAGTDDIGSILISYDTGRTWAHDAHTVTFANPQYKSIQRSRRDSFIAVGHSIGMTRGYIIWNHKGVLHNEPIGQFLNEAAMRDDSVAYAVGDSGTIVSNIKALLSVPKVAVSFQPVCYPNPTNGSFVTEWVAGHAVRVFDILGRMVLVNDAFTTRHIMDLSGQPRGNYVVEISNESGERIYQKLMLE